MAGTQARSRPRGCARVWAQIKNEDWSLVSRDTFQSSWPHRLWAMERPYHYIGGSGGYGEGYNAPAAVGAALAQPGARAALGQHQADGDLMYAPGVLWTAVHHKIPLLSVCTTPRLSSGGHARATDGDRRDTCSMDGPIGTQIIGPDIDYAKLRNPWACTLSGRSRTPRTSAPRSRAPWRS